MFSTHCPRCRFNASTIDHIVAVGRNHPLFHHLFQPSTCWKRCWFWMGTRGPPQSWLWSTRTSMSWGTPTTSRSPRSMTTATTTTRCPWMSGKVCTGKSTGYLAVFEMEEVFEGQTLLKQTSVTHHNIFIRLLHLRNESKLTTFGSHKHVTWQEFISLSLSALQSCVSGRWRALSRSLGETPRGKTSWLWRRDPVNVSLKCPKAEQHTANGALVQSSHEFTLLPAAQRSLENRKWQSHCYFSVFLCCCFWRLLGRLHISDECLVEL